MTIIWGILLVVFLILEAITVSLVSIWFAGGSIIAMLLAAVRAPLIIQVIAFLIISMGLILFVKPFINKYMTYHKTNIDSLIGEKCIVIEEINELKNTGKIKLNGLEWTARANTYNEVIPMESIVIIEKIEGVKAIVKKEKKIVEINEKEELS